MFEVTDIAGVTVNVSDVGQALEETAQLIGSQGRHYICFFEGNTLHRAYSDGLIRELLNHASLCYPDGIAVAKLMGWRLGRAVKRVSGPTFLLKACEYGVPRKWRHYFFGGKEGVAEELGKVLVERYPGLQVAGTYCPPFRDMTDEEVESFCKELREKKVDMLWVALGGPKQEKWMHNYVGRLPVPVMLGVGAAFDFHTNNQIWAPEWIRTIGLEWLWRLCTGGKRVFVRNVVCVSHVAVRIFLSYFGRLKYLVVRHPPVARRVPNGQRR